MLTFSGDMQVVCVLVTAEAGEPSYNQWTFSEVDVGQFSVL